MSQPTTFTTAPVPPAPGHTGIRFRSMIRATSAPCWHSKPKAGSAAKHRLTPTRLCSVPAAPRSASPSSGSLVASPRQGTPVHISPRRALPARRGLCPPPLGHLPSAICHTLPMLLSQAPLHGIATVAPRYCYGTTPDPLRMSPLHISSAKRLIVAFLPYETPFFPPVRDVA